MNDNRRYHRIIEQEVDIFVNVCQKIVKDKKLDKVWVTKDEQLSVVSIGDPDKATYSKNFGFSMYYETIVGQIDEAINEFLFKLNHFIKVAESSDKFKIFKNDTK